MSRGIFERAAVVVCCFVLILESGGVAAQSDMWTLESTVQRVLKEAPERRAADAEVKARQGGLRQAGVWPNPTVEFGASNALGKEDGQGGTDLNQFTVRQQLPLSGRLGSQRKQANAHLKQVEAEVGQQSLVLEYEAAQVFHGLQLRRAQLTLAEQRLQSADEFQRIGLRREQAGDLSRLERLRLDVVRESASQLIATAEGEYRESISDFQTLLNVAETDPKLAVLEQTPTLAALTGLEARMEVHPALVAARQGVETARHAVEVTRANRFADPEIWLAREQDFLGGSRQDVTAFGVAVTVPLWDRGSGNIDAAQATQQKAQFEVDALQRQIGNRLRLNHLHLAHLIEQTQEYRTNVLEPAEEIYQLSRKGFAAGEMEILVLIDAVDTYFEARSQYLELLQQCWLEAAGLRRAAGVSLLAAPSPAFEGSQQ
ncbi:MAG: TolC family protein [Gammaproteobacteria bacterium]|nr:TolC family protein [Gammaproteobacteria bacterium]